MISKPSLTAFIGCNLFTECYDILHIILRHEAAFELCSGRHFLDFECSKSRAFSAPCVVLMIMVELAMMLIDPMGTFQSYSFEKYYF